MLHHQHQHRSFDIELMSCLRSSSAARARVSAQHSALLSPPTGTARSVSEISRRLLLVLHHPTFKACSHQSCSKQGESEQLVVSRLTCEILAGGGSLTDKKGCDQSSKKRKCLKAVIWKMSSSPSWPFLCRLNLVGGSFNIKLKEIID